jgi:hypothetical protein
MLPAAAFAGGPRFERHDRNHNHEEAEHYKDKGTRPTKVDATVVKLQARALLDKAGVTEFELTTGQLDSSATPSGNINEVRIRVLRADGKKDFDKKYEHLTGGGYVRFVLTGLTHGQLLEVKAEVGVTGYQGQQGHQDVDVKLQTPVKYRPDMAVQKLDYPALARPGTVVEVSAAIAERLGDVGAHSDCQLFVDGKQVDAAGGIWVDAGSGVSCRFTHRFTTGAHAVSVRVQNCAPRDYDLSNNSLEGQIQIQNPAAISYASSVFEASSITESLTDSYYSATGTVPDKHARTSQSDFSQARYFSGQIPAAVNLPLKKVGYSDTSSGSALVTLAYADLAADTVSPSSDPAFTTETLIQRYDDASAGWVNIRVYKNDSTGAGMTTIDVKWDAGEATYVSEGYCKSTVGAYQCRGGDYTRNPPPDTAVWGVKVALGKNYAASVVVDDGTAYSGQPSMDLTATTTSDVQPFSCTPMNLGGPTPGKVCSQSSSTTTVKSGSVFKIQ